MLLLPKGTPLYENVAAATFSPPVVLQQLQEGRLTGYVRLRFSAATAVLLFLDGKLISTRLAGEPAVVGASAGGGSSARSPLESADV